MTNSAMKRLYKLYAFIIYLIPMIALFLIRREHYLQPQNAFGFFGFLVIILVCLYFSKQIFGEGLKKDAFIVLGGILLIIAIITLYIATEFVWIAMTSFVASLFARFVDKVAEVYADYEYRIDQQGIRHKNRDKAISQKAAWREAYGIFGE